MNTGLSEALADKKGGEKKMSKREKTTSLSIQLYRAFGILLALIIVLSIVSLFGLNTTTNEYNQMIDVEIEVEIQVHEVVLFLHQARKAETDFIMQGNHDKIDLNKYFVSLLKNESALITSANINEYITDHAQNISTLATEYGDTFLTAADCMIARGGGVFGPQNGSVGALHKAISGTLDKVETWHDTGIINETGCFGLQRIILDLLKDEKNYLLLYNTDFGISKFIDGITYHIEEFKNYSIDLGVPESNYTEIFTKLDYYQSNFTALVEADIDITADIATFSAAAHAIEDEVELLEEYIHELVAAHVKIVEDAAATTNLLSLIVAVVIIIISIVLAFFLSRNLSNPVILLEAEVSKMADNDLNARVDFSKKPATEIYNLGHSFNSMVDSLRNIISASQSSSENLSSSSEELAASSEEVNALSEEIAATIQQISRGATQQTEIAAAGIADIEAMSKTVDQAMNDIENTLGIITNVAEQTNILALNAAIEAARAGEYGRGFDVVADNVRRLAEDTKSNVSDISTLTHNIIKNLSESVIKITESFENFSAQSEEFSASSEEVAAATEEQTASMNQMTSTAQELSRLAEKLTALISQFNL